MALFPGDMLRIVLMGGPDLAISRPVTLQDQEHIKAETGNAYAEALG
jgi:hypothetical protein